MVTMTCILATKSSEERSRMGPFAVDDARQQKVNVISIAVIACGWGWDKPGLSGQG